MPTFVHLMNWTDQGIRTFRETVDRREAVKEMFGGIGVTLKETYWTLGPYDIVAVTEAPDDESATAAMLALGARGNLRSTTLRAFSAEEMRGLIEKAPARP